jgi:hypothetical protein
LFVIFRLLAPHYRCNGERRGPSSANLCPRELADANGDGNPDIVGFASSGVLISLVCAGFNFA